MPSENNILYSYGREIPYNLNNSRVFITVNEFEEGSDKKFKIKYDTGLLKGVATFTNFNDKNEPHSCLNIMILFHQNQ